MPTVVAPTIYTSTKAVMSSVMGVWGTATITPADISGLQLWLDGSDTSTITQSAGAVSQWNDKSGNGFHFTQATGANQPLTAADTINGRNVIKFDGAGDYLANTDAGLMTIGQTANTLIIVFKFNVVPTGGQRIVAGSQDGLSTKWGFLRHPTSLKMQGVNYDYSGSSSTGSVAGDNVNPAKMQLTYDGISSITVKYNGVTDTGAGKNTLTHTSIKLGISPSAVSTESLNGSIAEIIAYNKALSAGEQSSIDNYLSSKWGV